MVIVFSGIDQCTLKDTKERDCFAMSLKILSSFRRKAWPHSKRTKLSAWSGARQLLKDVQQY